MKTSKQIWKVISIAFVTCIGLLLTAVTLLFVTTRGDQSVPATVADDPSLPQVTIDGVTFHAETFGRPEDPTVVVVHGGPGGDYGYLLNLHELADDYHVVFYDQRGAGLSPRVPATELTLPSAVADLHRIISHYGGGEPVRLIGHSWGGTLTAAYIGQHPDMVVQAVLAEPGALDNAGLARFNRQQAAASRNVAYYRALVPTIFESLHLDGPDEEAQMDYIFGKMSASFVATAASGYRCTDERVTAVAPSVPVPPGRFGTTAFQTLFGPETDLSPIAANAANYSGELLFIASACNTFIGAEFQQAQMGLFPQAEFAVIPDAGHEMFGENPAASLAAVRTFFD